MRLYHAALLGLVACSPGPPSSPAPAAAAPAQLIGRFTDDYDNQFEISATEWLQLPHGRFHIVHWDAQAQYLIARNDMANQSAPGKWTRIDWMDFAGMAPYTWGFCLTAYDAATREAAEATAIAKRETPRTGCNGFPFSRMKQRTAGENSR